MGLKLLRMGKTVQFACSTHTESRPEKTLKLGLEASRSHFLKPASDNCTWCFPFWKATCIYIYANAMPLGPTGEEVVLSWKKVSKTDQEQSNNRNLERGKLRNLPRSCGQYMKSWPIKISSSRCAFFHFELKIGRVVHINFCRGTENSSRRFSLDKLYI